MGLVYGDYVNDLNVCAAGFTKTVFNGTFSVSRNNFELTVALLCYIVATCEFFVFTILPGVNILQGWLSLLQNYYF